MTTTDQQLKALSDRIDALGTIITGIQNDITGIMAAQRELGPQATVCPDSRWPRNNNPPWPEDVVCRAQEMVADVQDRQEGRHG